MTDASRQRPALWEVHVVWMLFALAAVAVFVTYWRLPPSELWKVTHSGLTGGAGRAFVFLSYSAALAAIAVVAIVVDRLEDRRAVLLGIASAVLCATVAIPGVQTPNDLDAKWANLPALPGVGIAAGLTAWAAARGRAEQVSTTKAGDLARLGTALVVLFFAAPYIAAELGFFLNGVPLLGWIFQTGQLRPEPDGGFVHAAVHHGHHHGLDGFLLAVTALLLSRLLAGIRRHGLRALTAAYLSLMLVYGLANMANDLWTEQVVKRDWTSWQIPDVLSPSLSVAWAAIVACAVVVYLALWRERPLLGRR